MNPVYTTCCTRGWEVERCIKSKPARNPSSSSVSILCTLHKSFVCIILYHPLYSSTRFIIPLYA